MVRRFYAAAGNKAVMGEFAFCPSEQGQIRTVAGSHGIEG